MLNGASRCWKKPLEMHGKPEIINANQGSQFTSETFASYVSKSRRLSLSMDGKGRAIDNAFIERLW